MDKDSLIQSRNKLLEFLYQLTDTIPEVIGIFLGGSLATKNSDAYSDIDFRILIDETTDKKGVLQQFIAQLPGILFIETQTDYYAVIHFDSFIKVDVFVYHPIDLQPSPWLANIAIYHDTNQFLATIQKHSGELTYQPTQEEFDFYLTKYYAYLHEYYRRWQRQETHYLLSCELTLKHCLVSLWYMEKGVVPNSLGDWSKYEGPRTKLSSEEMTNLQQLSLVEESEFLLTIINQVATTAKKLATNYSLIFNQVDYSRITNIIIN